MFGETTISYVKIGNHPIETTIYKWLFGVPGPFHHPFGDNFPYLRIYDEKNILPQSNSPPAPAKPHNPPVNKLAGWKIYHQMMVFRISMAIC